MSMLALALFTLLTAGSEADPTGIGEAKLGEFDFSDARVECPITERPPTVVEAPAGCGERLGEAVYRGYWMADRETSYFSFEGEPPCWENHDYPSRCIDVLMSRDQSLAMNYKDDCTTIYRVQFIGRRSRHQEVIPAMYIVNVDKVLSSERIGYSKPELSICGPEQ